MPSTKKQINFLVTEDQYVFLKEQAKLQDRSMNYLVNQIIDAAIKRRKAAIHQEALEAIANHQS